MNWFLCFIFQEKNFMASVNTQTTQQAGIFVQGRVTAKLVRMRGGWVSVTMRRVEEMRGAIEHPCRPTFHPALTRNSAHLNRPISERCGGISDEIEILDTSAYLQDSVRGRTQQHSSVYREISQTKFEDPDRRKTRSVLENTASPQPHNNTRSWQLSRSLVF